MSDLIYSVLCGICSTHTGCRGHLACTKEMASIVFPFFPSRRYLSPPSHIQTDCLPDSLARLPTGRLFLLTHLGPIGTCCRQYCLRQNGAGPVDSRMINRAGISTLWRGRLGSRMRANSSLTASRPALTVSLELVVKRGTRWLAIGMSS
jgi:hypothetical protein